MAERGGSRKNKGEVAEESPAEPILDTPVTSTADLPLPLDLPSAMFTGPGLLTLADLVPVMTAFVDRHLRYRFMNKPLAEWFERPRREMIGKHMREVLGEAAFADREEMLRGGPGRGTQAVRGDVRASHARRARRPDRLCSVDQSGDGQGRRYRDRPDRHHRAKARRTIDPGERRAVPAHRQLGTSHDVGHSARSGPGFRQRRLSRVLAGTGRRSRGRSAARLA